MSTLNDRNELIKTGIAGAAACAIGVAATAVFGTAAGALAIVPAGLLAALALRASEAWISRKAAPAALPAAAAKLAAIPEDRVDALTGLANANGLAAWFAEKAERMARDGSGIYVLLADLQSIGDIERQRGKETADAVVIEIAARVSTFTGKNGIAARTGGNEFVAVAAVAPADARAIAEEQAGSLAETITRPVELKGQTLWIGGSVGAAFGPAADHPKIMEAARGSLLKASRLGPGRYVLADGS